MKLIKQSHEIMSAVSGTKALELIEYIGRVCYKSHDRITEGSAEKFVKMIISRGHEAMLEHYSFTVKFVTNRRVSHELVRHRLCSFAQESQRYVDYEGRALTFIDLRNHLDSSSYLEWYRVCQDTETSYKYLRGQGNAPQIAGGCLSNDVATTIIVTANIREWRHLLSLRTASAAHPQMQELMRPLLDELQTIFPVFFDDIQYKEETK